MRIFFSIINNTEMCMCILQRAGGKSGEERCAAGVAPRSRGLCGEGYRKGGTGRFAQTVHRQFPQCQVHPYRNSSTFQVSMIFVT